jgi:hypothetical protein
MWEMTYAPGVAKVDLINPHKNDGNPASSSMGCPVLAVGSIQSGHNNMRNTHPNSTGNQNGLTPKLINVQNGRDSGKEHKDTADTTSKQRYGVSRETEVLEDEL